MSQPELVIRTFEALDALGIAGMLTGSHASSAYGSIRSTHDIDIVVDLTREQGLALLEAFQAPEFYASPVALEEAVRLGRSFSIAQIITGEKVDFFLVGQDPFDRAAFDRRRLEQIEGRLIPVMSPEDTILQKLRWAVLCGGSEKQFLDARGVFEVQYPVLDLDYIESWIPPLGVEALYRRLREEAQIEPD
jgi:hypothetical protein